MKKWLIEEFLPMWAKETAEGVFTFQNLCGAVSFSFNDYQEMRNMKIVSVKISSKDNYISGSALLNPKDSTFTLSGEKDVEKTITISYADGLAIQSTLTTPTVGQNGKAGFVIGLPVGEYAAGDLTVTITDSFGRTFSRVVTSALKISAGETRAFPTLSFTFAYGEANSVVVEPGTAVTFDAALRYTFAKDFLAAYKTTSGYDEVNLAKAFKYLYAGYCIAERPKMLYNESTKKYVLLYHADGPSDANIVKYLKINVSIITKS